MHSEHPSYLPNVLKAYLNVTQDDKSNAFAVAISHLAVNLLTIEFTCLMMLALHYSAGTSAISHASACMEQSLTIFSFYKVVNK